MVPREHCLAAGAKQRRMHNIGGMHKGGQNLATNHKVACLQTLLALLHSKLSKNNLHLDVQEGLLDHLALLQLGCTGPPSFASTWLFRAT